MPLTHIEKSKLIESLTKSAALVNEANKNRLAIGLVGQSNRWMESAAKSFVTINEANKNRLAIGLAGQSNRWMESAAKSFVTINEANKNRLAIGLAGQSNRWVESFAKSAALVNEANKNRLAIGLVGQSNRWMESAAKSFVMMGAARQADLVEGVTSALLQLSDADTASLAQLASTLVPDDALQVLSGDEPQIDEHEVRPAVASFHLGSFELQAIGFLMILIISVALKLNQVEDMGGIQKMDLSQVWFAVAEVFSPPLLLPASVELCRRLRRHFRE
jgi:hypothetical protein